MNTPSLQNLLLDAATAKGFLWVLFFFLLCFFGVHAVKLLRVGWLSYQKQRTTAKKANEQEQKEKKEEKKAPAAQEPIYYIVERKRRRPKSAARTTYGEPKPISFKEPPSP